MIVKFNKNLLISFINFDVNHAYIKQEYGIDSFIKTYNLYIGYKNFYNFCFTERSVYFDGEEVFY